MDPRPPAIDSASPWLACREPQPGARVRVVCFPSAGRGPSAYRSWPAVLGPTAEVWAVCLPGREARFREQPLATIAPLADAAADAIAGVADRPLVLFGHSMGAIVAFETARRLEARGVALAHLVAAGRRAPAVAEPHPLHALPDAALLDALRRFGGTPAAVLADVDLMKALLPALRADLAVSETYVRPDGPPLRAPLTALGGRDDHTVDEAGLQAWSAETSGPFAASVEPGGHFFVHDRPETVARVAGIVRSFSAAS